MRPCSSTLPDNASFIKFYIRLGYNLVLVRAASTAAAVAHISNIDHNPPCWFALLQLPTPAQPATAGYERSLLRRRALPLQRRERHELRTQRRQRRQRRRVLRAALGAGHGGDGGDCRLQRSRVVQRLRRR